MSKEEKDLKETVEEVTDEAAVKDAEENVSEENAEAAKEEPAKKEDDNAKKDPKDQLIEELQDKNKRQMAEFVNFRNRTEKEMAARYEIGARDVVEKILPVVDNFERGFASLTEEELNQPFAAGMDKIFKQLLKTLEDMDVKAIEAVGQEFDPNLHNAVMHVEDESAGEGVIIEEFQKGYTYRGNVVRHSMVKVAN
ncbi:MAG: nucleotide exchange factor GrpE [Lachnospiraceae bacterium]